MASVWEWETQWYGLCTFAVLIGSWFASCAPFIFIDYFRLAEKYRIQHGPGGGPASAAASPANRSLARKMVALNWCWQLPTLIFASPFLRRVFPAETSAPTWWQFPIFFCVSFVLHDISFYTYHRILHEVPGLYRRFHKPHHVFTAPVAWMSHATHPVEQMLQGIGGMAGPLVWANVFGLPVYTWWVWLALIQFQGVMDHTGYDFPVPLDIFGLIPGCGGTKFHDDHHKYFTCNYAACFSIIDDIMGTSRRCRIKAP